MLRKVLYIVFGLLVLLFGDAGMLNAQNLNGEVIQVAADALTVLKFNSEIKRYELGDRNGYTCQVRDNDNSVVIKTLADSCGATNLIVTEGKRSHYFIIHFLKDIDINKTKLFYDYSDLKELKRLVSNGEALASNTKDETKDDKKDKKQRKKEKEELEAKAREAEWLAQDQKLKEQEALAANKPKEQDAVASAAEPAGKKNKKNDKPREQPAEPVAKQNDEAKTAGVNNNTAAPYKEETIASAPEPKGKKNKKDAKGKAKQTGPKEEPVVANTFTVKQDTINENTGEPIASAQRPKGKKNKQDIKGKQTEAKEQPAAGANTITVKQDTIKEQKGEPVASAQEPAGKKNKKDTKGSVKQTEPKEQPVAATTNNTTQSDTNKAQPVASAQEPAGKKNKKDAKGKVKPVETKEEPVVAMAEPEKKVTPAPKQDAKKDSIANAKAEMQKLVAKEKERQALLKKYPNINFAEPPDGQMLTGDFFVPTDTAENYTVSAAILQKEAGKLNITSTNDKGLEVTLQDITFSGVNAYMRLLIRNKGKNEVPVGKMNVQWNKSSGGSYNLFACYVTSFPIIPPGKEVTIVYSTRAVNAGNSDNFIFTMNDRQDKFSTNLSFGGDVYTTAMGWKP